MSDCDSPEIKIARLEEQLKAEVTARNLAANMLEAWKLSANEWRSENQDQRKLYMTIDRAESMNERLEARVNQLEKDNEIQAGRNSLWAAVPWVITIIISIVALVVRGHP